MGERIYSNIVLTVVACLLGILALRPALNPPPAAAQSDQPRVHIEPGNFLLRKPDGTQQVQGRVMIDLKTGDVWGYPTLSSAPYPVDAGNTKPPTSKPMYLGKFDFSAMTRVP